MLHVIQIPICKPEFSYQQNPRTTQTLPYGQVTSDTQYITLHKHCGLGGKNMSI